MRLEYKELVGDIAERHRDHPRGPRSGHDAQPRRARRQEIGDVVHQRRRHAHKQIADQFSVFPELQAGLAQLRGELADQADDGAREPVDAFPNCLHGGFSLLSVFFR